MKYKILFGILSSVLVVGALGLAVDYNSHSNINITIDSKERVCDESGKNCKWMVLTDKGSFENTDSLFRWKFNSSDLQGKLKVGESFNVTTYGWRIPLISKYKNIVGIVK